MKRIINLINWLTKSAFCLMVVSLMFAPVTNAQGILIINSDIVETDNTVVYDADDTGGDIKLQFGNALGEYLKWDDTANSFKFSDDLDLENNELKNARIENLASAPTCDSTLKGKVYHNTADTYSYVCNGTSFVQIDGGAGGVGGTLAAVQTRNSAGFTLTNQDQWYDITFDKTDTETDSGVIEHDNTNTERINIKSDGTYLVTYNIDAVNASVTHSVQARIYINGSGELPGSYMESINYGGEHSVTSGSFVYNFTNGDYITLQAVRLSAIIIIGEPTLTITKLDGVKGDTGTTGAAGADGLPGASLSKLFQGIDSAGAMTVTNVAQPIPLTYVSIKDDYYSHSTTVNPAEVTILNEGWYKVDAMITVAAASAAGGRRGNPVMHIEVDSGSGFVQQPDETGGYIREDDTYALSTSLSGSGFFYFNANDVIRITIYDTVPDEPDEEIVAYSSRLVLAYIDRTGSSSGSVDNLKDIGDVDANAPSDGQVLTFDSATSKWKPEVSSGSGTDSNTFIFDQDDTGGDVILQFGAALNEYFEWNDTAQAFIVSDDLILNFNELKQFRIENSASALTCNSSYKGRAYYNTTDDNTYVCNGTAWEQVNGGGGSVFGTEYDYVEDETLSTTTSTSYIQKLRMTTVSLPAGDYRIGYSYGWALTANDRDFMAEVQVDGTTVIHDHHQEPKEKGAGQEFSNSGFKNITLGSGIHTIDIVYATENSGKTASIWNARLEIWRVE